MHDNGAWYCFLFPLVWFFLVSEGVRGYGIAGFSSRVSDAVFDLHLGMLVGGGWHLFLLFFSKQKRHSGLEDNNEKMKRKKNGKRRRRCGGTMCR